MLQKVDGPQKDITCSMHQEFRNLLARHFGYQDDATFLNSLILSHASKGRWTTKDITCSMHQEFGTYGPATSAIRMMRPF